MVFFKGDRGNLFAPGATRAHAHNVGILLRCVVDEVVVGGVPVVVVGGYFRVSATCTTYFRVSATCPSRCRSPPSRLTSTACPCCRSSPCRRGSGRGRAPRAAHGACCARCRWPPATTRSPSPRSRAGVRHERVAGDAVYREHA